jgi:SET domain-containing protein
MKILYGHILFIARRDIEPDEEITIDYESTLHSNKKRCICGALSCRGTINRIEE